MDNILKYFIEEPERKFHIREIAKLEKISPMTASKHLNQLKKEKILLFVKQYNHIFFRANSENPLFKDLKFCYNLQKIRKSGLIEHLNEWFNYPECILLFGSFRKAENTKTSDIDILIVSNSKKEPNLSKFESLMGHKIQLFIYSLKEINDMKTKNKELLNNFANGFVLCGFWEVFK